MQLLVGVAMVARGEFAYLVAKEARDLDAVGFDGKMLSGSSYAMVIWALVISTIASPLLFRWALKVYARAMPIKRGTQIGGDNEKYKGHAFVIKIMGHHHIGMLREVLDMLHASGVDILEAKAESDGEFDVDVFVVQSRGNQKDFDDDKLEEMRHELQELLNDAECQITFEPLDEDFQRDGIIEIQMIGDHHQDVLHEITDAIAAMGLDVLKMHSDTVTTIDHNKKKKVEHEIFYAKETDNSKKKMITPKRRAEIRQGLMKIMHELNLHGECMVKVIHESEAQVMHTVPHFDANERVCVVKCVGKHHKEMLHEICDLFAEDFKLDVLHAEVDVKDSGDEHIFYVERTDERYPDGSAKVVDRTMRHDLREAIRKIYGTHNFKGEVSVRPHQNPGAGAPINDRLSFERLPPAVVDTNGKKRIRIANGGVRWFDETSPHWLDSTFGESNDEISAAPIEVSARLTASGGFTPTPELKVSTGFGSPPMSPLGGAASPLSTPPLSPQDGKSGLPSPSAASPSTASASNETSRDRKRSVNFALPPAAEPGRESDGDIEEGLAGAPPRSSILTRPMRISEIAPSELAMSATATGPFGIRAPLRSPKTNADDEPVTSYPFPSSLAGGSKPARSPRDQRRSSLPSHL